DPARPRGLRHARDVHARGVGARPRHGGGRDAGLPPAAHAVLVPRRGPRRRGGRRQRGERGAVEGRALPRARGPRGDGGRARRRTSLNPAPGRPGLDTPTRPVRAPERAAQGIRRRRITSSADVRTLLGSSPPSWYSVSSVRPWFAPRCTEIVCASVSASIPSRPCRRPSPDALNPPIGAPTDPHADEYPSLTLTVPASTRAAIRRPRATSRVQTLALSPSSESFMTRTASSSLATRRTAMTGPNVSSRAHAASSGTSSRTVGA